MNFLKESLLNFYRLATHRARQEWLQDAIERNDVPVSILFYHRIADTHPNGWTISTKMFARQMDWLAKHYDFVSLTEAQTRLREGNDRPAVAITFDDGYSDNCDFAIPFLLRHKIPFTYFVSTQILEQQTAFEHDLRAGQRLDINTIEQLRAMANAGVEIGAHTRTHANMGKSKEIEWIREELLGSVSDLENWLQNSVRYFAFPFGLSKNMTREAAAVAAHAGLEGICSAYGAYNFPKKDHENQNCDLDLDAFHLRRIHADPEWARFLNWMTYDPRKLKLEDPIDDNDFLILATSDQSSAEEVALRV